MSKTKAEPFIVKDCALAAIAIGQRAQNLKELRDQLISIHPGAIYYHFWGGLLRPRFDDPEYVNDFAVWVRHALHDLRLAERLAIIDPATHADIEALRQEIIEVIEERMDEGGYEGWARRDQQFHFIRGQTVVFDSAIRITEPRQLVKIVPTLPVGSVYYHFVDARRRAPASIDDFRAWLTKLPGHDTLCDHLAAIDPYFTNLTRLRVELGRVFTDFFTEH